jgi:molecular chaperone Hsp33
MSADSVIGFAFESLPVRGALIHMDRSWRRMQRDHDYDALLTETLGHAAAATGLIAQSLKFDGAITLQLQGKGALQMLIMQCTSELHMRGMASVEADYTARNFVELAGNAHCAITVDNGDRPYQGIVAIDGESLSSSLEHYFERSVQVPSHVALVANDKIAAGLLLQKIPGEVIDADDWARLKFLAETLSGKDFDGEMHQSESRGRSQNDWRARVAVCFRRAGQNRSGVRILRRKAVFRFGRCHSTIC